MLEEALISFLIGIPLGASIFQWGYRKGIKTGRYEASKEAFRDNQHAEALRMNAEKSPKFRVRTAESDPSKQAVVKTARVRAFKSVTPDPKK